MTKRLTVAASIVLLLASLMVFSPVSNAFAHSSIQAKEAMPDGCQGQSRELLVYTYHNGTLTFQCSGYQNVDDGVVEIKAGEWSGYIFLSENGGSGYVQHFCDWADFAYGSPPQGPNIYVYYIYMSPTKEPWC